MLKNEVLAICKNKKCSIFEFEELYEEKDIKVSKIELDKIQHYIICCNCKQPVYCLKINK